MPAQNISGNSFRGFRVTSCLSQDVFAARKTIEIVTARDGRPQERSGRCGLVGDGSGVVQCCCHGFHGRAILYRKVCAARQQESQRVVRNAGMRHVYDELERMRALIEAGHGQ